MLCAFIAFTEEFHLMFQLFGHHIRKVPAYAEHYLTLKPPNFRFLKQFEYFRYTIGHKHCQISQPIRKRWDIPIHYQYVAIIIGFPIFDFKKRSTFAVKLSASSLRIANGISGITSRILIFTEYFQNNRTEIVWWPLIYVSKTWNFPFRWVLMQ